MMTDWNPSLFSSMKFNKVGRELAPKMNDLAQRLKGKVEERKGRIARIRKEYDITDAMLAELFEQHSRGTSNSMSYAIKKLSGDGRGGYEDAIIPAGVVNNMQTERDLMNSETQQAEQMELIARNLDVNAVYTLSLTEVKYLGF